MELFGPGINFTDVFGYIYTSGTTGLPKAWRGDDRRARWQLATMATCAKTPGAKIDF